MHREVCEWMCDSCNTVYPGPPQPGIWCVQCTRCGGDTAPRGMIERRRLEQEIERLRAENRRLRFVAERVVRANKDVERHGYASLRRMVYALENVLWEEQEEKRPL